MIIAINMRDVSLWQRMRAAWLLVFRGGFKFDNAQLVERGA